MAEVVLDAGGLIAVERGAPRMAALLTEAVASGARIAVPAGALAQAWRGSPRQARLARLMRLDIVDEVPLDGPTARLAGVLCGRAGTSDVVDASVVVCAGERDAVIVTSDPDDLRRLDAGTRLVEI